MFIMRYGIENIDKKFKRVVGFLNMSRYYCLHRQLFECYQSIWRQIAQKKCGQSVISYIRRFSTVSCSFYISPKWSVSVIFVPWIWLKNVNHWLKWKLWYDLCASYRLVHLDYANPMGMIFYARCWHNINCFFVRFCIANMSIIFWSIEICKNNSKIGKNKWRNSITHCDKEC